MIAIVLIVIGFIGFLSIRLSHGAGLSASNNPSNPIHELPYIPSEMPYIDPTMSSYAEYNEISCNNSDLESSDSDNIHD